MAAITLPLAAADPRLRPLNIVRDLPAVADLVEKCFAATMDAEGRNYIQQMRRAGQDNTFLRWASRTVDSVSMPLSGYVWDEGGTIIGNASLIPYRRSGRKYYLIANVAVHPDHRRRGIGRALTIAAMQHARQRNAYETWLHVRSDNPDAISLYRSLGFQQIHLRTTWEAQPVHPVGSSVIDPSITRRHAGDWIIHRQWLDRLYPEDIAWYLPLPGEVMSPGLGAAVIRFLSDMEVHHWVARRQAQAEALVTIQSVPGHSNRLWAAVPELGSPLALGSLLEHARRHAGRGERIVLEFPAGQYVSSFETASFQSMRTLLWMRSSATL